MFYSASSLKQQTVYRHIPPFGHTILIPNKAISVLISYCFVLNVEFTNANFIIISFFGTRTITMPPHVVILFINSVLS